MFLLTFRDLQHRAVRVGVVTMLVAVLLALLFLMNGLVHHLQTEPGRAVDAFGADHWIVAAGVSGPFTSASVLPAGAAEAAGVDAEPVVLSRSSLTTPTWDDPTEVFLIGHRLGELGGPSIDAGRAATASNEIVVDGTVEVGLDDVVTVAGREFTVVGTSRDTTILAGLPFVFVDLSVAQDVVFRSADVVSAFVSVGNPPDLAPFAGEASVLSADDVAVDALGPIESAVRSIDFVRILLWIVAGVVVGAVVYLSALERQRDFAVLKAVGASGRSLGVGLAIQAALIALTAACIGALLAQLVQPIFPLAIDVPGSAFWRVPALAVAVGLGAAIVGVVRINRTDPSEAFGGAT